MDNTIEKQIKEIENLISFYNKLEDSNNHIENYKKQLFTASKNP